MTAPARVKRVVIATDADGDTHAIGPVYTDEAVMRLREAIRACGWRDWDAIPITSAAEFRTAARGGADLAQHTFPRGDAVSLARTAGRLRAAAAAMETLPPLPVEEPFEHVTVRESDQAGFEVSVKLSVGLTLHRRAEWLAQVIARSWSGTGRCRLLSWSERPDRTYTYFGKVVAHDVTVLLGVVVPSGGDVTRVRLRLADSLDVCMGAEWIRARADAIRAGLAAGPPPASRADVP